MNINNSVAVLMNHFLWDSYKESCEYYKVNIKLIHFIKQRIVKCISAFIILR